MKGPWKVWVGLAVAFLLEESLFVVWPDGLAAPDLVAAVVVGAALGYGPALGAEVGVVGGLAMDLALGRLIGLNAALMALLAWIAGRTRRSFVVETTPLSLGIAGFALLIDKLMQFALLRALGVGVTAFLPGVVGVTLETLPFYLVGRWIFGHPRRDRDRVPRGGRDR